MRMHTQIVRHFKTEWLWYPNLSYCTFYSWMAKCMYNKNPDLEIFIIVLRLVWWLYPNSRFSCTTQSMRAERVLDGAWGGLRVSGGCFGQQRRGHGAGLGADRQQLVTGGNYPKAKHVPSHKNVSIQKKCLLFFIKFLSEKINLCSNTKLDFCFLQSKILLLGREL